MVERFFFDWIDTKATGTAISGQNHTVATALPHETHATLAIL
jgi:hypothetical protein